MFKLIKKLLQRKSREKNAAEAHFYDSLTRAERHQIDAAVARAKQTDKKENTGQILNFGSHVVSGRIISNL